MIWGPDLGLVRQSGDLSGAGAEMECERIERVEIPWGKSAVLGSGFAQASLALSVRPFPFSK